MEQQNFILELALDEESRELQCFLISAKGLMLDATKAV